MKKLLNGKFRFITTICCFVLGLALILAGAFTLKNPSNSLVGATGAVNEFVVKEGASVRYSELVPGIRFEAEITKAQRDRWLEDLDGNLADGDTFTVYFTIKADGMKDQAGDDMPTQKWVVKAVGDARAHDYDGKGNFVARGAVYLEKNWNDDSSTAKTQAELYHLYNNVVFSVESAVMGVNATLTEGVITPKQGTSLYTADNTASTARTIRSVATVLYLTDADGNRIDFQKDYIKDELGALPTNSKTDDVYYYDKTNDNGALIIDSMVSTITKFKASVGAEDVTSNVTIEGNTIKLSGIQSVIGKGETKTFILDAGDNFYTFNAFKGATEIIYTKDRFLEIFDLDGTPGAKRTEESEDVDQNEDGDKKDAYLSARGKEQWEQDEESIFEEDYAGFKADKAIVETYVKDGVTHSVTFYGKSPEIFRGYYVLGADIDMGGSFDSTANHIKHAQASADLFGDTGLTNYNGLFGFGGTFDGNGYEIKNAVFENNTSVEYATGGLFGSLAYGAEIKNLALTNVLPTSYVDGGEIKGIATRYKYFIATGIGDSATLETLQNGSDTLKVKDYLIAKYGTTNTITLKDMYVSMSKSTAADYNVNQIGYFSVDGYNYTDYVNVWGLPVKDSSNNWSFTGPFGLVRNIDENCATMENIVFEIPNPTVTVIKYERYGFTAKELTDKTQSAIKNSYLISGEGTAPNDLGMIPFVGGRNAYYIVRDSVNNSFIPETDTSNIKRFDDSVKAYDGTARVVGYPEMYTGRATSKRYLAANDYDAIGLSGLVHYGRDASDGNKWKFVTADEGAGKPGNITLAKATGVNRYDTIDALVASNDAGLSKLNPAVFNTSGTGLFWIGGEKGLAITITEPNDNIVDIGDTLTINATIRGVAVDATELNIVSSNSAVLNVGASNAIEVKASGEASLTISYTNGDKSYSTIKNFKIIAKDNTLVYVSTNEGLVDTSYDAETGAFTKAGTSYAVPYVEATDSNDLELTSFEALYKKFSGNSSATLNSVALFKDQAETAYQTVQVAGATEYVIPEPTTIDLNAQSTFVLKGTSGEVNLGNVRIITNVVKDTVDFKYIPSSKTSVDGYYVLANDYDTSTSATYSQATDQLLTKGRESTSSATTKYYAYSMGYEGLNESSVMEYKGFNGTFDGLGHTINNMQVNNWGLFGKYTTRDYAAKLVNTIFTNFRASRRYWDGTDVEGVRIATRKNAPHAILAADASVGITDAPIATHKLFVMENVYLNLVNDGKVGGDSFYESSLSKNTVNDLLNSSSGNTADFAFFVVSGDVGNGGRHARFDLKNNVFEYKMAEVFGATATSYGGGYFIAFLSEGYQEVRQERVFANIQGNYFIVPDCANIPGKPLGLFHYMRGFNSGAWKDVVTKKLSLVGYASNEFDALNIPVAQAGDRFSTEVVPLYEGLNASSVWTISATSGDIITPQYNNGDSKQRDYVRIGAERYYDYTAMLGGETQKTVGGLVITADGVAWNK